MKRTAKHRRSAKSAPPAGPGAGPRNDAASTPPPPRRRWLFRLLAVVVLPLLVLGTVEIGLRLTGYGYAVSFFKRAVVAGQAVLVENDQFGLRFFPPAAARSPAPVVLQPHKPAGTFRIFLFGESAALGDPRPAYGMGRYLEVLLRERYPSNRFEIVCVAMTAINSHALRCIARDCAALEGDLWIVYAGHNEMAGPFGANTVFGAQAPPLPIVRATLALRSTRTGQWLTALGRRLGGSRGGDLAWAGMKMFEQAQLPPDDPRRTTVRRNFQANLDAIVRTGLGAGAKVLLCAPASNLRDCAPFASLHGARLRGTNAAAWTNHYERGIQAQTQRRLADAASAFADAAAQDPLFAALQYRLATVAYQQTNPAAARAQFELARDYDALPFRADASLRAIVTETARRYADRGVAGLDATEAVSALSADGLPGQEAFHEHVHLTFAGNYAVARALAEEVAKFLPPPPTQPAAGPWASAEVCDQRLGLTDWNRYAVLENVFERISDAPFTNQLNHPLHFQNVWTQLSELKPKLHPSGIMDARFVYEDALKRAPADFRLHENFAEFLEVTGSLEEAAAQWGQVQALLPHHYLAYYQAGRLLARLKQAGEAAPALARALALRPDLAEAYLELGQLQAAQGKPDQALIQYAQAKRLRPEDPRIYLQMAHALAAQKRREEAVASLREAARLRPSYWQVRYYLGVELAVDEKVEEAAAEFAAVTRLRPDFALAHLNLGIAYARQSRLADAYGQFQETLRLDPQNPSAQKYVQQLDQLRRTNSVPVATPPPEPRSPKTE